MLRLLDYLFITRPILFFPGWATMFIGYWFGIYRGSGQSLPLFYSVLPSTEELFLFAAFAFLMGGSFIFNQIRDIHSDRINDKLYFIHDDIIPLQNAWVEAVVLLAGGFILFYFLDNSYLLITASLFTFVTAYLYNFPPFECKNKIICGLLMNMLMGECAFALGYFFTGNLSVAFMIIDSLGILLINTGLYIITTLPDIQGDIASDKKTIGAWAGVKNGSLIAAVVSLLGLLFLPWTVYWVFILSIIVLVFMTRILFSPQMPNAVLALKIIIFVMSLLMAVFWLWFLLIGITAYWITKKYFKARFGLNYPGFNTD